MLSVTHISVSKSEALNEQSVEKNAEEVICRFVSFIIRDKYVKKNKALKHQQTKEKL
jgi:hypothetical protein